MTYSRTSRHCHRPRMLNGRVRNGNGCGHPGLLTGKSPLQIADCRFDGLLLPICNPKSAFCNRCFGSGKSRLPDPMGGRVGAAKRLAVSTGRLKRLPAVHVRPIDLVVFQEPVQHKAAGDLF